MHKICFAFYHSFFRDTRFTQDAYQALKQSHQGLDLK